MTIEKYGVDKQDPIEQKAKEMVKKGSANNIEDAREKIVLKNNNQKESE